MIGFIVGCTNSNLEKETKDFVINNNYDIIYRDLSNIINEVRMFPTKDKEEKFIYYIEAIKENYTKFTNEELNNISSLLNFEYNFNFNGLDYTISDYKVDQDIIKGYIE